MYVREYIDLKLSLLLGYCFQSILFSLLVIRFKHSPLQLELNIIKTLETI